MNCDIDSTRAGSFADALEDGAARFCNAHPAEKWEISGVVVQHGLSLNASSGKRRLQDRVLPRVIDMADSVFEALEEFRNSN
jgi:hypothetical protein